MSLERERAPAQGIVHRVTRLVPIQSVKIVIIAWQILTQVRRRHHAFPKRRILKGLVGCHGTGSSENMAASISKTYFMYRFDFREIEQEQDQFSLYCPLDFSLYSGS